MSTLRLIFGDQLSTNISSLYDCDQQQDIILMCEVEHEANYVKHHQKKLVLIFSAMRHFAAQLKKQGYQVCYFQLDVPKPQPNFLSALQQALNQYPNVQQIVVTKPSEYRVLKEVESWSQVINKPITMKEDDRFLCSSEQFNQWAKGRKQLRMEYFYRLMRQQHQILMDGDQPVGGQWNFDAENRKPPKTGLHIPDTYHNPPDTMTEQVIKMVANRFADHFGDIKPFHLAVTREQALDALSQFIKQRLAQFGDYQDAMIQSQAWMYHAHISFYLNCGLLLPLECVQQAEQAYRNGKVPLNATEGFIRQIIGWREYVRGIYWLKMPDYESANFLNASRSLPDFYWTGKTRMNCLKQAITETQQNAYAHHIQRLMVLGNFALLAGIDPVAVNEWFLVVYADAYQWVELPNVTGMVLFADGGILASKPYAAGGSYIHKMSNYCQSCHYKVSQKQGPQACPFNYLYWDFLTRHRDKLANNPRIAMMYRTYDRMDSTKQTAITHDAQQLLTKLEQHELV
jgi:deoxyribodipyrimidine photolyase-related protein